MNIITASIGATIIFSGLYWLAWELNKKKYSDMIYDFIIEIMDSPNLKKEK